MTNSSASEHSEVPRDLEVTNHRKKGFYISGNVKWMTEVIVIIFAIGVGWATLSSQQSHTTQRLVDQKDATTKELTRQYDVLKELVKDRSDHDTRISVIEEKLSSFKEQMSDVKKLLEKISSKLDEE